MTTRMIDSAALAVELVRHCKPEGLDVDFGVTPDIAARLPIAVLSTTPPTKVSNGPHGAAAAFSLHVSVLGAQREQTRRFALDLYGAVIDAWRSGWVGANGWISRIANDGAEPAAAHSALIADNVHRWDFIIPLVARH